MESHLASLSVCEKIPHAILLQNRMLTFDHAALPSPVLLLKYDPDISTPAGQVDFRAAGVTGVSTLTDPLATSCYLLQAPN